MRIASPSLIPIDSTPRAATVDVVKPSRATDVERAELGPTPTQLWEEARRSLVWDPMEPEPGEAEAAGPLELTDEEQAVVDELRARDAQVRAHEAVHAAIGGGTPSYEYRTGPDGKRYAVGGQVVMDASGGSTEQGTIHRMRRVRTAALAPGQPSAQDMAVAAEATQREAAARSRMRRNGMAEVLRSARGESTPEAQERAASAFADQQARATEARLPNLLAWA